MKYSWNKKYNDKFKKLNAQISDKTDQVICLCACTSKVWYKPTTYNKKTTKEDI